jgi:hypothetical protein
VAALAAYLDDSFEDGVGIYTIAGYMAAWTVGFMPCTSWNRDVIGAAPRK